MAQRPRQQVYAKTKDPQFPLGIPIQARFSGWKDYKTGVAIHHRSGGYSFEFLDSKKKRTTYQLDCGSNVLVDGKRWSPDIYYVRGDDGELVDVTDEYLGFV